MVGMCLVFFLASMSESGFTRLEDFQDALGGVLLLQDSQSLILQSLNLGKLDSDNVVDGWGTFTGMSGVV